MQNPHDCPQHQLTNRAKMPKDNAFPQYEQWYNCITVPKLTTLVFFRKQVKSSWWFQPC